MLGFFLFFPHSLELNLKTTSPGALLPTSVVCMCSEPSTQPSMPECTASGASPGACLHRGFWQHRRWEQAPESSNTLLCSGNAAQAWILLLSYKRFWCSTDSVLPPNPANTEQSTSFSHVPLPREITPHVSQMSQHLCQEHADFHSKDEDPPPKLQKLLFIPLLFRLFKKQSVFPARLSFKITLSFKTSPVTLSQW